METDQEDLLFELQLTQKTNKEIVSALKSFANPTQDNGMKILMQSQIATLEKIATLLSNLPKPEKPLVNVTNDNSEIANAIKEINNGITSLKECMSQKTLEWEFEITARNTNGFIQSGNIKAK